MTQLCGRIVGITIAFLPTLTLRQLQVGQTDSLRDDLISSVTGMAGDGSSYSLPNRQYIYPDEFETTVEIAYRTGAVKITSGRMGLRPVFGQRIFDPGSTMDECKMACEA